jgi:UDP-GlcNAc:undecaprenyl-phosphate GlcNAc-1-phosphate transferase
MHVGGYVGVPIPISVVIGGFIIVILGLWDDLRSVRPGFKIAGQVLAALVLISGQVGTASTRPLLGSLDLRIAMWFGFHLPGWVFFLTGSLFTIALVVFCCNAYNLMDGLDGLCGGVTAVIAVGLLFLAVHLGMLTSNDDVRWVAVIVVLALALLGAVLGFVPFNFNPASIFLGDTGSMFLGFACATLVILMAEADSRWLIASLVMFALPVLDTSLAFARRYVNKRPLFSADRHHFHHQLVARGLSVRKTVLISYLLTVGFVILGSTIVYMRTRFAIAIYMVVFGSIIVAAYKMGMVHEKRSGDRSDN